MSLYTVFKVFGSLFLISFVTPSMVWAASVLIDPGRYENSWWTYNAATGKTERYWGPATVEWNEGLAAIRVDGGSLHFDVTATDIVPRSLASATVSSGTGAEEYRLELQTLPVVLNLNGYIGSVSGGGFNGLANSNDGTTLTNYVIPGVDGAYGLAFQNGAAVFTYKLDTSGHVTDINPAATATAVENQIFFNTAPVTIDPQDYLGSIRLWQTTTPQYPSGVYTGLETFVLPVGLTYNYTVGGFSVLSFHLQPDGTVISSDIDSAVGEQNLLTLYNTPVQIDVGGYEGSWTTGLRWQGEEWWQYGSKQYTLVPGVTYSIRIQGSARSYFRFDLSADGTVGGIFGQDANGTTYTRLSQAADAVGNAVSFRNVRVSIDPAGVSTGLHLNRAVAPGDPRTGVLSEPFAVTLVPDMDFEFMVGGSTGWKRFQVDGDGIVTTDVPGMGHGGYGEFSFTGVNLRIAPLTIEAGRAWSINYYHGAFTDTQDVVLIPGIDYRVSVTNSGYKAFSLFDPCATAPQELYFTDQNSGIDSAILALSCDVLPPDTDADGIPDEADNCPLDANPNQIDLDSDGAGDACDADIDGDGVDNTADNCPQASNQDQRDADQDGTGDLCDDDDDGDSIPDAADNCPFDANTSQSDNDGDGMGDACDVDDDNDLVDDEYDNCRFTANEDQGDFDGDGEGDACDGDADGDGVGNDADLCADTPAGSPVSAGGCNGSQYIALLCPADGFANHGRYVSCVTHAANDAVSIGLIQPDDKSRYIREAAKSK